MFLYTDTRSKNFENLINISLVLHTYINSLMKGKHNIALSLNTKKRHVIKKLNYYAICTNRFSVS